MDESFEGLVLAGTQVLRAVVALPEEAFSAPPPPARPLYESSPVGVVFVVPWGLAYLFLIVVFGLVPLSLAAVGGIVLRRRRQRRKRAASSVAREVHLPHVHLSDET